MAAGKNRINWQERITDIYGALLLTVFLFYCGTGGYAHISQEKYHAFLVISGGYAAVMLLLLAEQIVIGAAKPAPPGQLLRRSTWPQRLAAAYLILTWVSAVHSPFWPETAAGVSRYEGALTITVYCLCFLLASVYGGGKKRLLYILGGAAAVFCVLCLMQMGGLDPLGLYPPGLGYRDAYTAYAGAYLGTIGNADLVAAFLSLAAPVLLYGVLRGKGRGRFFLLVPLALAWAVLVKMDVKAGLLGAGVGCLLAFPVSGLKTPRRRHIMALALGAGCIFALGGVYFLDLGDGMLHEAHLLLHGQADPTLGSGRIHIWMETLAAVPAHPWLGAGPDTMLYAGLGAFTRYDPALGGTIVTQIDVAHNEYLNILYHQGAFALAVYLALLTVLAGKWIKAAPVSPAAAALGAGALGYCVQAFFGFSMCVTAPFFWFALGLLAGEINKKEREQERCGRNC